MKTTTIKQEAVIAGSPHQVFELLMDSEKHSAFTGDDAIISRQVGGEFSVFSGWATGKNIELEQDKKIVQSWRGSDWPTGHSSTVTFTLLPAPGGKTILRFSQTDVPSSLAKDVAKGWREYYWGPMKESLTRD